MYIILINGHVGCLKTTLSYLLASSLGIAHISTSIMGPFVSDKNNPDFIPLRNSRYERLKMITDKYLSLGISVVLDGNFPFKKLRQEIYSIGRKYNVIDIISIKCTCDDISKLEQRFKYRRNNLNTPDSNANTIDAYWGSVKDYESIVEDKYKKRSISRINFESGQLVLEIENSNDVMAIKVHEAIKKLIHLNKFEKPYFE